MSEGLVHILSKDERAMLCGQPYDPGLDFCRLEDRERGYASCPECLKKDEQSEKITPEDPRFAKICGQLGFKPGALIKPRFLRQERGRWIAMM